MLLLDRLVFATDAVGAGLGWSEMVYENQW